MRLIETWLADQERAFDLFAKFPAEETGFENPAAGMNRERFAAYVQGLRDESLGVGLPDGWVPATKYILVNDEGDYVGIFNLRHRLTDFLRNGPGHIGYGVAREYRGHGYATAGLKLTLAKARELGIKEAYLSVHKPIRQVLRCSSIAAHVSTMRTRRNTTHASPPARRAMASMREAIDGASCV